MNFEVLTYGNPMAATQLVQMVDDHDMGFLENEVALIRELSGGQDFGLQAVRVENWNRDLSPSIWFPGFVDYMRGNEMKPGKVYLSLGDREERTRNPVMAQVGNAIRQGYDVLQASGIESVLEWNKGNHFKDADLRTAKAFAWLMKQ